MTDEQLVPPAAQASAGADGGAAAGAAGAASATDVDQGSGLLSGPEAQELRKLRNELASLQPHHDGQLELAIGGSWTTSYFGYNKDTDTIFKYSDIRMRHVTDQWVIRQFEDSGAGGLLKRKNRFNVRLQGVTSTLRFNAFSADDKAAWISMFQSDSTITQGDKVDLLVVEGTLAVMRDGAFQPGYFSYNSENDKIYQYSGRSGNKGGVTRELGIAKWFSYENSFPKRKYRFGVRLTEECGGYIQQFAADSENDKQAWVAVLEADETIEQATNEGDL